MTVERPQGLKQGLASEGVSDGCSVQHPLASVGAGQQTKDDKVKSCIYYRMGGFVKFS